MRVSSAHATIDIPRIHSNQIESYGERLGQGAYGRVEKGRLKRADGSEPQLVAIKYATDRDYIRNLMNEAKAIMSVMSHPNVIKIYGICESHLSGVGLVMEFMDCRSLAELLRNRNINYTIDHFSSWMLQLCSAVDYFHSNKQIHRDLKVQNMLLSNKYRTMKLCDFGTYTDVRSTMTGTRGTPITMAPEVMNNGGKYDMKSDIYSIGIIMWQILSREEPFPNANQWSIYYAVTRNIRPQELLCSYILSGFYRRCWHQDPTVRPTSKETVEYFTLLCKEYPNSNVPLIVGNDTIGSIGLGASSTQSSESSSAEGASQRPVQPPSESENDGYWKVEDSFKPVEPDIRDSLSLQIYNDHMAELERLKTIEQLQQKLYSMKHDKNKKWNFLEQQKSLKHQSQISPDSHVKM